MRAAVVHTRGETPRISDVEVPSTDELGALVRVAAAGLNPSDSLWADGTLGELPLPRVVGNEGAGCLGGRRVYFERSVVPHGSLAEYAKTDVANVIDLDDDVDDVTAVALGISGLAGWVPLEHTARLLPGEAVLVLGASGPVGQVAVQAARLLGAGTVVAAARHRPALAHLVDRGMADASVQLGSDEDAARIRSSHPEGFDVIVDPVFGQAFVSSLPSLKSGGRVIQLGMSGGAVATIPWISLLGRSLLGYKNTTTPQHHKLRAYQRMMRHAAQGDLLIPTREASLESVPQVWGGIRKSPHAKLVVIPG